MGFYEQVPEIAKLRVEYLWQIGQRILGLNTALQDQWENWKEDFGASVFNTDKSLRSGLFSAVLNSNDGSAGRNFTLSELWAEGSFLMLAGRS